MTSKHYLVEELASNGHWYILGSFDRPSTGYLGPAERYFENHAQIFPELAQRIIENPGRRVVRERAPQ